MTPPQPPRPVPGPPQQVPGPPRSATPAPVPPADAFGALAGRPVVEHVAVFEAEHDRLRRELSTIDQL